MSLEKRTLIDTELRKLHTLTGIALLTLALYAGVPKRTWREWQERSGEETKHNGKTPRTHWLTPEETQAIIKYCETHINLGYRPLCYQMLDENIAAVAPGSVYNALKRHGTRNHITNLPETSQNGYTQPLKIHEQWHTDFSYIKICGEFYYFISLLDGYSRKILVWDLCPTMDGIWAEVLVQRGHELYPDEHPRIISDNGSQFCSKDFEELIKLLEFEHTFTSPSHPQSNGKLERFHRTFKTEHVRRTAFTSFEDAKNRMAEWLCYYNERRLHSAIQYLTPDDIFFGHLERRLAERKEKLHNAYITRVSYWQNKNAILKTT